MEVPTVATPSSPSSSPFLDPLTGLPSRSLFLDRLNRAVLAAPRGGGSFAVLFLELAPADPMEDPVDAGGDARICEQAADALAGQMRQSDTVSRLSGATFGLLLPGTSTEEGLGILADKLLHAVRLATSPAQGGPALEVAIGAAVYPDHGHDATTLMRCADTAVAQALRDGTGLQIGRPTPARSTGTSAITAGDLRAAVANGELVLHFHPKVDLATRRVVGAEALVRWERPGIGQQLPGTFIPAAERLACIAAVTDAVVDLALDQAKAWFVQGLHLPVSVNISARSLDDEAFVERILRSLSRRGLPPSVLSLEVTESALASRPGRARSVLRETMDAGIGVSLDDFGAGQSSLRVLRDLGVSEIKIDRQFVRGLTTAPKDASIVRSISQLASGLEARVVAEGIENRETWEALLRVGCHLGQGYGIARPMAARDFDTWLSHWKRMASDALHAAPESYYS